MTEENKKLLLRDLCGRLPYGVQLHLMSGKITTLDAVDDVHFNYGYPFHAAKPYLRPLSSMTEEELQQIETLNDECMNKLTELISKSKSWEDGCLEIEETIKSKAFIFEYNFKKVSYLNSIHIDYNGLIDKGLALEAPEGMYDIKKLTK